ncbi:uncharacterized protein LOC120425870 [Culex pipiens pallens]|uniref:uncharacterized protein LOC120425870 n=1 Tax=Culex pipiens pallens TaxID=42434 RepID=UPI001954AEAF|nr:uncharacterized protein LOC120425870 [Culex pipiens pallens]
MSFRKNRRIDTTTDEAIKIIIEAFTKFQQPLQKINVKSHIFEEICSNLHMNKKQKYKHKQCLLINHHIEKLLKNAETSEQIVECKILTNNDKVVIYNNAVKDKLVEEVDHSVCVNNSCVEYVDASDTIEEINQHSNNEIQHERNNKPDETLEETFPTEPSRMDQVNESDHNNNSNNAYPQYNISFPSSEAHYQLDVEFVSEIDFKRNNKNNPLITLKHNIKQVNESESSGKSENFGSDKSETEISNLNHDASNGSLNQYLQYSVSSPSSGAHDQIEMEFENVMDNDRKERSENIQRSGKSENREADIINKQVMQEIDKQSEGDLLQSHSEDLDQVNIHADENKSETEKKQQSNNEKNNRNNRDHKILGWRSADFTSTGLSFIWTRQQFALITNNNLKGLTTYDDSHKNRKEAETLQKAEDITSYHDLIRDVHPTCVMYVHKARYTPGLSKMKTCTIETVCQFQECKRFILRAKFLNSGSEDIKFDIYEDMKTINHPVPMATQIRAKERIICLQKTCKVTPVDYHRNAVMEYSNDPRRVENKLLKDATTAETIRKLYEDRRARTREDKDHFVSLQKMSDKPDTFIWHLSYKPFLLIILTEDMIATVLQAIKLYGPLDWYFDATGSYWRDPRNCHINSQLYMYSLITRFASNVRNEKLMTFPLAIIFTTAHNTKNIELFISLILNAIERRTSKHNYEIFRTITTDFAMSNLNALTKALNQLTIVEYLNKCYNLIEKVEKESSVIDIVIIKLCSSHLSKLFEKAIWGFFKDNEATGLVVSQILKALYNIRNIDEIYKLLKKLWQYLLSECEEERIATYQNLNEYKLKVTGKRLYGRSEHVVDISCSDQADMSTEEQSKPNDENKEEFNSDTIYGNSPFYKRAFLDFKSILNKKNPDFEFLNKPTCDFILMIIRRYITYLVLFTPTLTFKQYDGLSKDDNDAANRANNGVIEAHHKNTKQDIRSMELFVGKPPIRLDDYIKFVFKKDIEAKIVSFKLQIPNSRVTRNCRSTEKKKSTTTPTRKRKSRSLETTPAKVKRNYTPSISNSIMMSKMRLSDIKNTRETFVKRIQPISHTNLSGTIKKTNRKLFSPSVKHNSNFISIIPDVTKTPVAASTPKNEQIINKNRMIQQTTVESLPNDSTLSALEVIPEEQSEQLEFEDDAKLQVAISTSRQEQKTKKNKLIPITTASATSESQPTSSTISALEVIPEQVDVSSKAKESDLYYFSDNTAACYGISYQVQPNYLISNVNYYTKPRPEQCNILNVAVKQQTTLTFEEIFCLSKKNYQTKLINFLVDFCMLIFSSMYKKSISILKLSDSDIMLGILRPSRDPEVNNYRKKQIIDIFTDHFNCNQVILPLLRYEHYTCVIIDQTANTFCLLDSLLFNNEQRTMIKATSLKESFINNISNMLKDCHGTFDAFIENMKSLKLIYRQNNYQTDDYNCGVYLLNNVEMILQAKEPLYDGSFNPTKYRKHLINVIITHSDNVLNICPGCSVIEKSFFEINPSSPKSLSINTSINDWIECVVCKRFWHTSCALRKHDPNNMSSFTCLMCQ